MSQDRGAYIDFWVTAHPNAKAGVFMEFATLGEATWKIPESQTGDTWIQAQIYLNGIQGMDPPDGDIHVHVARYGWVRVANSFIEYWMYDDASVYVYGTLWDLDGPHPIDTTYPGPTVSFTVRQYIDPGEHFETETTHGYFYNNEDNHNHTFEFHTHENEGTVAGGIYGTTAAYSTYLKAFANNP